MASVALTKDDLIIGGNIRKLRENHNHTQKYLAGHIDYSDNHLCAVENGRKPASAAMILRLAEYYDMTLEYFYKGTSLKFQLRHRIRIIAKLMEELSEPSVDLVDELNKRLWSLEHGNADAEKRMQEIESEMKSTEQENE